MEKDDSVDAPADTIKWVKNLYLSKAADTKPSLVRRIIATLLSEIEPGKAAFGERSASASQARQMLFSAEEAAIDLRIKENGKKLSITGQIVGDGFENAKVRLFNNEREYTASATELAEFELQGVVRDSYSLSVAALEVEIVIENIDLR